MAEPTTRRRTTRAPEPPPLPQDVDKVLAQLGAQATKVIISRVLPSGRHAYVTEMPAREFSQKLIQDKHGGGDYVAQIDDGTEGSELVIREFSIDNPPVAVPPMHPQHMAGYEPGVMSQLITLMREIRNEIGAARYAPVPAMQQAAQQNPLELVAQLGTVSAQQMTAMVTAMQALIDRPGSSGGGSAADPDKFMSILLRGIELGKQSGVEGGDPTSSIVLASLGKEVLDLIRRRQKQEEKLALRAPDNRGEEVTQDNQPAGVEMPNMLSPFGELVPFMPQLQQLAQANTDARMVAATIEVKYPQAVEILAAMVDRMDWDGVFAEFYKQFPAMQQYHTWVFSLFQSLVETDAETSEGDETD